LKALNFNGGTEEELLPKWILYKHDGILQMILFTFQYKRFIMKSMNLIIMLFSILILSGCQTNERWEYKVLSVSSEGLDRTSSDAFKTTYVSPTESELNKLGAEGWELVTSYLELETAYPNFGSESYVTGLQPNIRPQRAILLFKRHLKN
jgi:hypothetical protein